MLKLYLLSALVLFSINSYSQVIVAYDLGLTYSQGLTANPYSVENTSKFGAPVFGLSAGYRFSDEIAATFEVLATPTGKGEGLNPDIDISSRQVNYGIIISLTPFPRPFKRANFNLNLGLYRMEENTDWIVNRVKYIPLFPLLPIKDSVLAEGSDYGKFNRILIGPSVRMSPPGSDLFLELRYSVFINKPIHYRRKLVQDHNSDYAEPEMNYRVVSTSVMVKVGVLL